MQIVLFIIIISPLSFLFLKQNSFIIPRIGDRIHEHRVYSKATTKMVSTPYLPYT